MKKYTWHHYLCFTALALTAILAICKVPFWYMPVVLYFAIEIGGVVALASCKGKLKDLPKIARKASKVAWKR